MLDEQFWVTSGCSKLEWEAARAAKARFSLERFQNMPRPLGKNSFAIQTSHHQRMTINNLLEHPQREKIANHPCFEYWLQMYGDQRTPAEERRMLWGLLQGFLASTLIENRRPFSMRAYSDPNGQFYFNGTPYYLQLPGVNFPLEFNLQVQGNNALLLLKGRRQQPISIHRVPEIVPGLLASDSNWLLNQGVKKHHIHKLKHRDKFVPTLRAAFADIRLKEPYLSSEINEMLQVLIPLKNPHSSGSISSSYSTLPGAVALSHSDDVSLQAETMIHEYCHQKLNLLTFIEPLLLPGQSRLIFYSPWRDDARHLRGILYGAHAFLNVARYLMKYLESEIPPANWEQRMGDTVRRLIQTQDALQTLSCYGSFTEFGRQFILRCWKELARLQQNMERFPPEIIAAEETRCQGHRAEYALPRTGLHKNPGAQRHATILKAK